MEAVPRVRRLRREQSMMQDHRVTTLTIRNNCLSSDHDDQSFLPGETPDVYCLAISRDSRFVAVGCTDGIIRVFNASSGNLAYTLSSASTLQLPITSICFRPPLAASQNRTGVLIAASADGTITHWHMSSQTRVFQIREEEENQVYAADYACDGATFCAAGQDAKVRLYDEPTKMLVATLQSGKSAGLGHTKRVYATKFAPGDPNTLVSGGWDNTVQIWDVRAGAAVRCLFGPHVCGDAIDVHPAGTTILTGSWRSDKALQLWDLGSGKLVSSIEWHQEPQQQQEQEEAGRLPAGKAAAAAEAKSAASSSASSSTSSFSSFSPSSSASSSGAGAAGGSRAAMVYACAFSPDGSAVAAGGSGGPLVKVFSTRDDSLLDAAFVHAEGVYALKFSPSGRHLAAAGKAPQVALFDDMCHLGLGLGGQGQGRGGGGGAPRGEDGFLSFQ